MSHRFRPLLELLNDRIVPDGLPCDPPMEPECDETAPPDEMIAPEERPVEEVMNDPLNVAPPDEADPDLTASEAIEPIEPIIVDDPPVEEEYISVEVPTDPVEINTQGPDINLQLQLTLYDLSLQNLEADKVTMEELINDIDSKRIEFASETALLATADPVTSIYLTAHLVDLNQYINLAIDTLDVRYNRYKADYEDVYNSHIILSLLIAPYSNLPLPLPEFYSAPKDYLTNPDII